MTPRKISFIGAGNMTRSIVEGLVANQYPAENIMASNPSQGKLTALQETLGIHITQNNADAIDFADLIVLSVKPQLMAQVCSDFLKDTHLSGKLVVSIAAGITSERLCEMLNGHSQVVRVMPNTPSSLGYGMSGVYASAKVSDDDAKFVAFMMNHVGETLIVKNEDAINTVIAAAGSSPAYFFLIAQSMQEEAINMGMDASDARKLVQQAMLGSAHMIKANPDTPIQTLRENVMSKGGTTAKAVESLQNDKLAHILAKAMQAAVTRAEQMSKEF
ncbi:pyrroline-5-carboxylate reductase [Glaciecola siphonariae]|uniref:Pyrroline-5-carboxylate reductase n=1 Tax=Glaciecola siphonariae TaxID=521012 RepID=A0ABV9LWH9_9ALTE